VTVKRPDSAPPKIVIVAGALESDAARVILEQAERVSKFR